jgi:acetyltransferase-like isoleucine patch superfamily enzyme
MAQSGLAPGGSRDLNGRDISKDIYRAGLRLATDKVFGYIEFEAPTMIMMGCFVRELTIGSYSSLSQFGNLNCVKIGRYCSIAGHTTIGPGAHPVDRLTSSLVICTPGDLPYEISPFAWFKDAVRHEPWRDPLLPIEIGHDVFIGTHAVVMGGLKIGTGAVIGAGAVVTRDVEPYTIVGGSPARVIRPRFDAKIAERLLALEWWNYDLVDWIKTGRMPKTSNLGMQTVEALEASIAEGHAPKLKTERNRLEESSTSWNLKTTIRSAV